MLPVRKWERFSQEFKNKQDYIDIQPLKKGIYRKMDGTEKYTEWAIGPRKTDTIHSHTYADPSFEWSDLWV